MKIEEQMTAAYEAPLVEVIEVEVEKGFAASDNSITGSSYSEPVTGGSGSYPWMN